ncbi:hypothetical protein AM493_09495 [Flavobacterium akiainvivens]|uniref:EcsC family protein n=2 Tax=Flavobacterium akiainvivens TaxID=1202724 RepID=A0A0M8MI30_9FLAO|nr:hypothetical protein AM493_09495 [Flavobacterium akiainvivens]SFQ18189.1 EcsC protein family protein [Flavobacterium akiainvivens]
MPSFTTVESEVYALRFENPHKTPKQLAELYLKKTRRKYTSIGVATALPGVIPGLGTAAQIAIEAGAVSADVLFMLRWMASLCYGTALIYGRDIKDTFEDDFTVVLGIWAGVVEAEKAGAARGERISVNHFDKHVTDRIRNRMNQKIGRKLITKYGSKRGGVALGTLIPFGVGAVVGGTFNYFTIDRFGKAAIDYFGSDKNYIVTG